LVCCIRVPAEGDRKKRLQEVSTHTTMTRAGAVNLTERNWESRAFVRAGSDSVGGKQVQEAGTWVTSFQVANRSVISER
jgi:hypothetical protein